MEMFGNADAKPSAAARLLKTKVPLWTALVLIVLLIAMGIAQYAAVRNAERQAELERQELARTLKTEIAAAQARNRQTLVRQSDQAHLLFGSALAWAVRSALVQNRPSEVDQYFAELVKNDGIKLALLVDGKGKIVASSDRQFAGKSFGAHFAPELLRADRISLHPNGGDSHLVIPIRGLTTRLGTVLVAHTAPLAS